MGKNLLLGLASLVLSLFIADWVLGRLALGPTYVHAITKGVPYDTRSKFEVVQDYRRDDPNWFPAMTANTYLAFPLLIEGHRVIPLGGVANANVVACNEAGFYATFSTDAAGFNNPQGTWPLRGTSNIFLVGDSFTYGDCVKEGQDIASQLRNVFPSVISLSNRGNGPLQELATIREYVPSGMTDYVFWLFYERNDLIDVNLGKADSILIRYLDSAFSQELWRRQKEVNFAVRNYTEELVQKEIQKQANKGFQPFGHLGNAISGVFSKMMAGDPDDHDTGEPDEHDEVKRKRNATPKGTGPDFALFKTIMAQAKQEVEQKGGKFVFVYLPSYRRFSGEPLNPWANHKEAVMAIVNDLGIRVVDLERYFRQQQDPLALFPLGLNGHYNARGYALVAEILGDFLNSDGRSALTSNYGGNHE